MATTPRTKRRWGRWLAGFLALATLIGAIGLGFWLRSDQFQSLVRGALQLEIERITGEHFELEGVRIGVWPPAVVFDGARLTDPETAEVIVSAAKIRLPLVLRGGGIKLGRLEIVKPLIQLHLEPDGKLREFRDGAGLGDSGEAVPEIPFSSLAVRDGAVRFYFPDGVAEYLHFSVTPVDGPVAAIDGQLHVQYKDLDQTTRFHVAEVGLGPDKITIPDFVIDFDALDVRGSADIELAGPFTADLSASSDLEQLAGIMPPGVAVHGRADVDIHAEGTPQEPRAEVVGLGTQVEIEVPAPPESSVTTVHYRLGDVAASADVDKTGALLERLQLHWGERGVITGWGRINPDLSVPELTLVADDLSLEHILKSFDAAPTPWIDFAGDAEINASGTLNPLRLVGDFDLVVADLEVGDRPISAPAVKKILQIPNASARGTLLLEATHIVLVASTVRGPQSRGTCTADIGFGPKGPLNLVFDLSQADLSDFAPLSGARLRGRGAVSGRISGPFNKLHYEGKGDIEGFWAVGTPWADHLATTLSSPDMKSIVFTDAVATKGVSRYEGDFLLDFKDPFSMHTDLTLTRGRVEDIVGMFLDLPGLKGEMNGYLSLHGPFYDLDGDAQFRMTDLDLWGERFESGQAVGYMDDGLFTLDDLTIHRKGGREALWARGTIQRQYALNLDVHADGFTLEGLDHAADLELPLTGRLRGWAHVGNTLSEPAPDGFLQLTEVRYGGQDVDNSMVRFETTDGLMRYDGELVGETVGVEGTLGLWGAQEYAVRANLRELPAHLVYPVAADGGPISALVSGDVLIGGHFGEVWSPAELDAVLSTVDVRWGPHHLANSRPWKYHQLGQTFDLLDFALEGGRTSLRFDVHGRGDEIDLAGKGLLDTDLLRAAVPGLSRADGLMSVDVSAIGKAPDVQAVLDVNLDGSLIKHESVPAPFEDVSLHARLTQSRFDVLDAHASLGGGTAELRGFIDAERWRARRWALQAAVQDAQMQWVEQLPPAIGDATIAFDGPSDALLLHGDVAISEMVFSDRINWEDWVVDFKDELLVDPVVVDEVDPMFNLNLNLVADKTITLRNNVVEGTASADLQLIGDTNRPGLLGWVRLDPGGLAFLQDREFRVQRGNISFLDPWSWDPDLDFDLLTEIQSRSQNYRVHYQILGPFSDWKTVARSEPALPQSSVNALLWFGVTTEELQESGELLSAVLQGVGDLVLADLFINTQVSGVGEDLLVFDRVELATGINARGDWSPDPRLIVSKRFEQVGDIELTAEINLARSGEQYYRVEKHLSEIWRLSGWYATLRRERGLLPIGGAFGVDVRATWEAR